jgi:hypothetical protein
VPLSLDVAFKLERALGIPASLWLNLETNYRAEQKRAAQRAELKSFAPWARQFPIRELVRCGYLREVGNDSGSRVEALLAFFGLTSPSAWEEEWSQVTARFRTSAKVRPDKFALTAWLRRGELEAQGVRCAPFEDARFRAVLAEARKLTTTNPKGVREQLVPLCAATGVAVTFIPALPRLAISGATRWLGSEKAVISLSLRYKTDDQLWFSFFHEACHVLEHRVSAIYVDSPGDPDTDPAERRANEFARDLLIPPADYARLVAGRKPGLATIRAFAAELGISPGIVVGRLQHEGVLAHSFGNDLKTRLVWAFEA